MQQEIKIFKKQFIIYIKFWTYGAYPHRIHWKRFLLRLGMIVAHRELSLAPKKVNKGTHEGIIMLNSVQKLYGRRNYNSIIIFMPIHNNSLGVMCMFCSTPPQARCCGQCTSTDVH